MTLTRRAFDKETGDTYYFFGDAAFPALSRHPVFKRRSMEITHMHGRWEIISRLNYAHYAKVLEARNAPLRLKESLPRPGHGEGPRRASEALEQPDRGV